MVLVNHDRDVGVGFDCGQHQMAQIGFTRVFACAYAGLQDDRAVGFLRGFHDGEHLLQVVDVESGYAVAVFGSVV